MAANLARKTLQFSSASARVLLNRSSATTSPSNATKLTGLASSQLSLASRFSLRKLSSSKLPVELGGALSLMPMHSVTASALFTSLLSLSNQHWGCLSEGFTTPL